MTQVILPPRELSYRYSGESIEAVVSTLSPSNSDRVLALCGSGDHAFALLENAGFVDAVDFNLNQVLYAQWRAEQLRQGRYEQFLGCRGSPSSPELSERNDYFRVAGRLNRIRKNLKNLRIRKKDLFDALNEDENSVTRIFLSNLFSFGTITTEEMQLFVSGISRIPDEAIVYSTEDIVGFMGARQYSDVMNHLQESSRLTLMARRISSLPCFKPTVYVKKP